MSIRLAVLVAALVGLLAAPASAKGPTTFAVCGADGCTDVTDRVGHIVLEGGKPQSPPRTAEPSFILHLTFLDERDGAYTKVFENRYLPESGRLRTDDGTWMALRSEPRRQLERVTRRMEPLPPVAMGRDELAPRERPAPRQTSEEAGDGDGMAGTAIAVAAPAALALGLAAMVARRRRRRRR